MMFILSHLALALTTVTQAVFIDHLDPRRAEYLAVDEILYGEYASAESGKKIRFSVLLDFSSTALAGEGGEVIYVGGMNTDGRPALALYEFSLLGDGVRFSSPQALSLPKEVSSIDQLQVIRPGVLLLLDARSSAVWRLTLRRNGRNVEDLRASLFADRSRVTALQGKKSFEAHILDGNLTITLSDRDPFEADVFREQDSYLVLRDDNDDGNLDSFSVLTGRELLVPSAPDE